MGRIASGALLGRNQPQDSDGQWSAIVDPDPCQDSRQAGSMAFQTVGSRVWHRHSLENKGPASYHTMASQEEEWGQNAFRRRSSSPHHTPRYFRLSPKDGKTKFWFIKEAHGPTSSLYFTIQYDDRHQEYQKSGNTENIQIHYGAVHRRRLSHCLFVSPKPEHLFQYLKP